MGGSGHGHLKVLSQYLPEMAEDSPTKLQSGYIVSGQDSNQEPTTQEQDVLLLYVQ
jgi:hypothetical protein